MNFPKLITEQAYVFWLIAGKWFTIDANEKPVYNSDATATDGSISLPVTIGLPGNSVTIESLDGGKTWSEVDNEST